MTGLILLLLVSTLAQAANCPEIYIHPSEPHTIFPPDRKPVGAIRLPSRPDGSCVSLIDIDYVGGIPVENIGRRNARIASDNAARAAEAQAKADRDARLQGIDTATIPELRQIIKDLLEEMGRKRP